MLRNEEHSGLHFGVRNILKVTWSKSFLEMNSWENRDKDYKTMLKKIMEIVMNALIVSNGLGQSPTAGNIMRLVVIWQRTNFESITKWGPAQLESVSRLTE
jgi:hypothetical protein